MDDLDSVLLLVLGSSVLAIFGSALSFAAGWRVVEFSAESATAALLVGLELCGWRSRILCPACVPQYPLVGDEPPLLIGYVVWNDQHCTLRHSSRLVLLHTIHGSRRELPGTAELEDTPSGTHRSARLTTVGGRCQELPDRSGEGEPLDSVGPRTRTPGELVQ